MDNLGTLSSGIVTSWCGWRLGQWWHRLCSGLSASVGCRCTFSLATALGLRIHSGAILASKASGRMVLMKHSQVAFHRILHIFMPSKLNSQLHLFSDLGVRFLDQELRFIYCGA